MTVYKVPVTVKKIKTFLKNALVFDMEFYFGHIIIHTYVRTSLYVCITIWEYTCTNMFSDAGKTYFGIPHDFADKPQTDRKNRLLKTCFSIERTEEHSLQGKVV